MTIATSTWCISSVAVIIASFCCWKMLQVQVFGPSTLASFGNQKLRPSFYILFIHKWSIAAIQHLIILITPMQQSSEYISTSISAREQQHTETK